MLTNSALYSFNRILQNRSSLLFNIKPSQISPSQLSFILTCNYSAAVKTYMPPKSILMAENSNLLKSNEIKTYQNYLDKFYSTAQNTNPIEQTKPEGEAKADDKNGKEKKKMSKFKQLYTQYGPTFLVVHLITVVLWIYGFFLISKQGYDITQLLNVFEKMNLMSKETVENIHYKIDNYKTDSSWITGQNIKHFATAYMVYKVIAPFRYVVSISIVRVLVRNLKRKGIMKD